MNVDLATNRTTFKLSLDDQAPLSTSHGEPSMSRTVLSIALLVSTLLPATAHDVWLQVNTPVVRTGEPVQLDLRLGNHGNHHRDFRLAGLVSLDSLSLDQQAPEGDITDLRGEMFPTAMAEREGYWATIRTLDRPGVHRFVVARDQVMDHGRTVRSVRTAQCYVLCSDSLDHPRLEQFPHAEPLGLPFELTLETCPFRETAVGQPIRVRVRHGGKPKPDVVVSFIPFGAELQGEFDPDYQVRTDDEGRGTFVPREPNLYLVVARHDAPDEATSDYQSTSYSATVTLHVPAKNTLVTP